MASHIRTTIRYDGPALAHHEMDVQDLAPALLALAEVIQVANQRFNGSHATIKVLVNADVEQRCFMVDISLVQSLAEQARTIFGLEDVKTAKEIAEWVGIIGGGAVSFFGLLRWLAGSKAAERPLEIKSDGDGNVTIVGNNNTIIVPEQVYQLTQIPRAVEKAKAVMRPLENDGYETMAFIEGDRPVFEVTKNEAMAVEDLPSQPLEEIPTDSVSHIRGKVRIKSAQYEGTAQWSFLWSGRAISAEMVDRAAEWVSDFQENRVEAPPNSVLDVTMIEIAQLDTDGKVVGKPSYKVQEVHGVTPPPQQRAMFSGPEGEQ